MNFGSLLCYCFSLACAMFVIDTYIDNVAKVLRMMLAISMFQMLMGVLKAEETVVKSKDDDK